MRTKSMLCLLVMTVISVTCCLTNVNAGFPAPPGLPVPPGLPGSPKVNVSVNGYLPAPPGVNIQIDAGRPYYVERERRVYLEKEKPGKHHKKKKKQHEDNGHKYGHYK